MQVPRDKYDAMFFKTENTQKGISISIPNTIKQKPSGRSEAKTIRELRILEEQPGGRD